MWQSYMNGLLLSIGLIMAIGAQNAFVLSQSLRREHHIAVASVCIICDSLLITAGVFGLASLLAQSPLMLAIARRGGITFLLWYGAQALRRACRPQALKTNQAGSRTLPAVLMATLAVTLLNPHVYLDTVLLIGSLGAQQPMPGAYAMGAASASLIWFSTLAFGGAWLAPKLSRPITWRLIDIGVAIMMFGIAMQLLMGTL
jgi:L-lysine exporter family protein LysE/ArgO